MRLLSRALQEYGGAVETAFEPTGVVCKLWLRFPRPPASRPPHLRNLAVASESFP